MTQDEFVKELGIGLHTLSSIENGQTTRVSSKTRSGFKKLASKPDPSLVIESIFTENKEDYTEVQKILTDTAQGKEIKRCLEFLTSLLSEREKLKLIQELSGRLKKGQESSAAKLGDWANKKLKELVRNRT